MMSCGYEQVRSIAAALPEDQQAADDVQLVLLDLDSAVTAPAADGSVDSCCSAAPKPESVELRISGPYARHQMSGRWTSMFNHSATFSPRPSGKAFAGKSCQRE